MWSPCRFHRYGRLWPFELAWQSRQFR